MSLSWAPTVRPPRPQPSSGRPTPPRAEARLRIVHAVDRSPYEIAKFSNAGPGDAVALSAESVLADAEAVARKRQPCIEVAGELFQGSAAAVLRTHAGKSRRDRDRRQRHWRFPRGRAGLGERSRSRTCARPGGRRPLQSRHRLRGDRHRARRLSRRRTSPRLRFRAGDTPREHTTRRLHVATTGARPHPRKRP